MAYEEFKDLTGRTDFYKILVKKHLILLKAKNRKDDGYQGGFASMVYNFFDKKTSGGAVKNENVSHQELAKELHKPIIKIIEIPKVY